MCSLTTLKKRYLSRLSWNLQISFFFFQLYHKVRYQDPVSSDSHENKQEDYMLHRVGKSNNSAYKNHCIKGTGADIGWGPRMCPVTQPMSSGNSFFFSLNNRKTCYMFWTYTYTAFEYVGLVHRLLVYIG